MPFTVVRVSLHPTKDCHDLANYFADCNQIYLGIIIEHFNGLRLKEGINLLRLVKFVEIFRLLHGKCARMVFTHEFSDTKTTSS